VNLHPPGARYSKAGGGVGPRQVGYAYFDKERAGMWTGTSASWTELDPPGASFSYAYAADAGHQAGSVRVLGAQHASVWTGSPNGWVALRPADPATWGSDALAVSGGQQVGYSADWTVHAALWTGSAASWVDLSPPGATYSIAYAVDAGRQGGIVRLGA